MEDRPLTLTDGRKREAARIRNRRYYDRHRDSVLERGRMEKWKNRELERERLRRWRAANRVKTNAYARKARDADPAGAQKRCREWRAAHPGYSETQSIKLAAHRQAIRDFLNDLKVFVGCVDCGYREHTAALEFDHIGPKGDAIAKLFNVKKITVELGNCVVRCANCHAIRTSQRRPPRVSKPIAFHRQATALKLATGCVDCGFDRHPAALHFDHVSGEKVRQISRFRSMVKAKPELEKCVLRCANDHRIITDARR